MMYYDNFPNSIIEWIWNVFANNLILRLCCCCLSEEQQRNLRMKTTLSVETAPSPQDVIWENLEFGHFNRILRSLIGFALSLLAVAVSFGIVLGLNFAQAEATKEIADNAILTYGISIAITLVISGMNIVMSRLFTMMAQFEKPWSKNELHLKRSIKLTIFTFFNSAVIPLITSGIQFGFDSYDNLVNNMFIMFLSAALVTPLLSLSCYDWIMQKMYQCWAERGGKSQDKELKDYTQRELNEIYEYPDMDISSQYSNLSKNVMMS